MSIRQLAEIADAAAVRMLEGDLVGFAVYHDEDKYPYLWNWRTDIHTEIIFPIYQSAQDPNPSQLPVVSISVVLF